ncbi:MAG TPA: sigma-70 family RNA polymerase sigma factor [Gemmataceae bacterium]|nr:sigma-70 family RNA polymerase sigma factor [Gemmataceae bacterium]
MADLHLSAVLRKIHHLAAPPQDEERADGQLLDAFLTEHEEAAFATLVRRHGPMVLGVCRRILHDLHDAEDAFQATFLVLFRRAATLDRRGSVAGWLYTVAYRAALKAKASANRRRRERMETRAQQMAEADTTALWHDLRPVLDEEMNALPEKYRLPVLLCYVEGKTNTEAARLLGWPAGTVKGRLARARELLRRRLSRRGVTVPAVALSVALSERAGAAVPSVLLDATMKMLVLAGGKAVLATPVAELADGVLRGMTTAKLKTTLLLLTLLALGLGSGIWARQAFAPGDGPKSRSLAIAEPAPGAFTRRPLDLSQPLAVRGRVVAPDGKPIPNAHVAILIQPRLPGRGSDLQAYNPEPLVEFRAGPDGRFHWQGTRPPFGTFGKAFLVAKAKGYGLTWTHLSPDGDPTEQVLQLAPERVAHGRLVDLEGQPAAGVSLEFDGCGRAGNGEFDGIQTINHPRLPSFWPAGPVVTDSQGRFTLRGFDDRENVGATVRDPRFAYQPVTIPAGPLPKEVTKVLVPGQTLEGTVLAADTGKPLPHARLTIYANDQEPAYYGTGMCDVADANGHFRINPWRGKYFGIAAFPADGTPYLTLVKGITWPKGAVKHTVDMRLPRGVLVRGTITETGSGRPIARASIQYQPRSDNKAPLRDKVLTDWPSAVVSGADGSFAIAVLPGPGTLLISGPTLDFVHRVIDGNQLSIGKPGGRRYYPDAVVRLDLRPDAHPLPVAVSLKCGVTVRGSIFGPDGKPVAEALIFWRHYVPPEVPQWRAPMRVVGDRFQLRGVDPDAPEVVYFLEPTKQWGAMAHIAGKQTSKPLRVQLQACGQATVRYVNQHGKPVARRQVYPEIIITPGAWQFDHQASSRGEALADSALLANVDRQNYWRGPVTGADGRCTLPALIPGCRYRLDMRIRKDNKLHAEDGREFKVRSGQTLDLGNVIVEQ